MADMKIGRLLHPRLVLCLVLSVLNTIHPIERQRQPLVLFCTCLIILLGYHVYSWRHSKIDFLKRILLGVPFALAFGVFMKLIGYGTSLSAFSGVCTYMVLLSKTPSWKHHFSTILTLVCAFAITWKFAAVLRQSISAESSYAKSALSFACISPFLYFFMVYMHKIDHGETPVLRVVLVKSLKLSLVVSSYFAAFLFVDDISRAYGVSFRIQFLSSCSIAILLFVTLYALRLFPWQSEQKMKNKSKLGELQSELDDYLEELSKTKRHR